MDPLPMDTFEELVGRALDELPDSLSARLDNPRPDRAIHTGLMRSNWSEFGRPVPGYGTATCHEHADSGESGKRGTE